MKFCSELIKKIWIIFLLIIQKFQADINHINSLNIITIIFQNLKNFKLIAQ